MTDTAGRLQPGDTAPDFSLTAADGTTVTLRALLNDGQRVVLYFYPAAMTPGCTTEACDFRDSLEGFSGAGMNVVGISPDPPEKLARFRDSYELGFPLLSDPDNSVMAAYGAYGEKRNYGRTVQGVIRSTLVVGPDRTVHSAFYNVKATGHVDRVRRELGI